MTSVVIATRIHLGKSMEPPTDLEEKIELFARFCHGGGEEEEEEASSSLLSSNSSRVRGSGSDTDHHEPARHESISPSNGSSNNIVGVIAVDAEHRIAGYDLVESVRRLCAANAAKKAAATGGGGRRQQLEIHVLPVQPWGNFTPALNALIQWACETQSASQILFVSAETAAPRETALATLQSHLTDGHTLVVGAVLPGHDHNVPDGLASVSRELSGRTTPWNTLALWDLSKLSLTGFQLVSEGLRDYSTGSTGGSMGGVEEVAVIALHQLLFPGESKAKLVPVDGIRWEQDFTDPARRQWHEQKMQSKVERPAYQLGLLRLRNGTVEHFAPKRASFGKIHFVVTGFGPFDKIDTNPTETICRKLRSHLQQSNCALGESLVRSEIIETSAEAARQAVADIFVKCDPIIPTIIVHLGLNKDEVCFHLEQCAYNEAKFRVPDQRGYQPHSEPVVVDRPIEDFIETTLDVQLLAERMTEVYQNAGTVVSQDPGRFVCNYTYYRSLLFAQGRSNTTSLFVHIPDMTSLTIEELVIYVERLLEQLQRLSETMPIKR
jgi:pyrrolidone-carboxylate peptidase